VGGWITENFSWRWVFLINLPVGILSLSLISLYVHDPPYLRRGSMRFDAWGMGMLAVGMGALQVMLDKGQEEDWFGSRFITVLAATALAGLTAFVIRELRTPHPLVKLSLLKIRSFAAGIGISTVLGFVLYGSLVSLPLFLQELLGWNAQTAGLWTSPRGLATAACMPLVGFLVGRNWDARWMLAFGMTVTSMAFFGYSTMNLDSGTWNILGHQLNQGLGQAFLFVPLTLLTMEEIAKEDIPYATSLFSVMRNIGSSMGISFVTTLIARRSQLHQVQLAGDMSPQRSAERLQQAQGLFLNHGADPVGAARQALGALYRTLEQQASLLSFIDVFYLLGWLFLLATPLVLLMRRVRGRAAQSAASAH
jgi:DHA2 family multidrug resistance protein